VTRRTTVTLTSTSAVELWITVLVPGTYYYSTSTVTSRYIRIIERNSNSIIMLNIVNTKLKSWMSVSCGASLFMVFYMALAFLNIYYLMYPLSRHDISNYDKSKIVKPLWDSKSDMNLRVYLSTKPKFDVDFFQSDFVSYDNANITKSLNHALLWDEKLNSSSFSKSFLLTTSSCTNNDTDEFGRYSVNKCDNDKSYQFASNWLDKIEENAIEIGEGGVLKALASAGQGIESTSALLTLYDWMTNKISALMKIMFQKTSVQTSKDNKTKHGILERKILKLPSNSPIWKTIRSNSSLYLHVLLVRKDSSSSITWPPSFPDEAASTLVTAHRANSLLLGQVNMIKYESPHHIGKPTRVLFNDLMYYWRKYVKYSREMPPWVMEISKPEETYAYKQMMDLKKRKAGYPYWKPEVSIKYVNDDSHYPNELVHLSGLPVVQTKRTKKHPTGVAILPAMHVDEMGLTSDKVRHHILCDPDYMKSI
jgi:hypothetical protein